MSIGRMVLGMAWISKFVLMWLMILRVVPIDDWFAWGVFFGFWVISFMTSATLASIEQNKGNDSE